MGPYRVLELRADSPEVTEQLGSKRKFWFRVQGDEQPWLFKYTRENTGEDWSEKIASELAKLLNIPAAQVELATFMGQRGCASRSFVETKKGVELIHGSEIMAGRVLGYQKEKQWGQSDHSISNIIAAVEQVFPAHQRTRNLRILASYILLDALICNTDRHHDNWGLLRVLSAGGKTVHSVAPSFDHASSLGRELLDDRRQRILSDPLGVERYVLRGHGGIYFDRADVKGENPLVLAIKASKAYPAYFSPILTRVRQVHENEIHAIVGRIPMDWMNELAREFCFRLLVSTLQKLREAQP